MYIVKYLYICKYLNEVGNHLKYYYKNLSKDALPTWLFCIGFFYFKINYEKN